MAYRPVIEDDALPHQIRIFCNQGTFNLSCTCRRTSHGFMPIEGRHRWEPIDIIDAWYDWHAAQGEPQPRTVPRDAILGLETVP